MKPTTNKGGLLFAALLFFSNALLASGAVTVLWTEPLDGALYCPTDTDIKICFSKTIDWTTLNASTIQVVGSNSGTHSGAYYYDGDTSILSIDPATDFSEAETITVTVTTSVRALDGDVLAGPYIFSFQTLPPPTPIPVGGALTSNTVWEAGNVYLVTSDLTVPAGVTLTIEAGVIVKFDAVDTTSASAWRYRHNLIVNGVLDLLSTPSQKIIFTSSRDDGYGGDSNGDASASTPAPGNWGAIQYNNPANVLHDAIIRFGGLGRTYDNYQFYDQYMVWVRGSTPGVLEIRDCILERAYDKAIYVESAQSPNIHNNTIRLSGTAIHVAGGDGTVLDANTLSDNGTGIHVAAGNCTVRSNTISGTSGWALYVATGSPSVEGNTISGNVHGIYQGSGEPAFSGNVLSGNTNAFIGVGGSLGQNTTWEDVQGLGLPYLVTSDLTVPAGVTLTIEAGVIVKFDAVDTTSASAWRYRHNLIVNGVLDLLSTPSQKIIFTSSRDDGYGGDSNGDASASTPAPGNWGAIQYNNPANVLHDAIIRFGGLGRTYDNYQFYDQYMVWVRGSTPGRFMMKRCILQYAYETGLYVQITASTVSDVIWANIFNNCPISIRYEGGTAADVHGQIFGNLFTTGTTAVAVSHIGTSLTVHHNRFDGLTSYGVQSTDSAGTVDAQQNWWGDETGPSGVGPGFGAQVSAYVDYSDWWIDPEQTPSPEGVSNVFAQRRGDSLLVDIYYDIIGDPGASYEVRLAVSTTGGEPYTIQPSQRSLSGAVGTGVSPELGLHMLWDAAADGYTGYTSKMRVKVTADME